MEFLRIVKRRSFLNEVVYVGLNVGLAVVLAVVVRVTGSLWPAFGIVLLSMWRVFGVRPRFWFANIQTNLVSTIVSVSYVVFLYIANTASASDFTILVIQSVLAILYASWLLILKPQSKRIYIVMQAGAALFTGITAIFAMSYGWIATPVVLLTWLVGYATAKHALNSYDNESHSMFLSLVCGMILAEIGWLAYHWTIAYRLPLIVDIPLPQVSIIALCFGFLTYKSYDSYYHHQKIRLNDILFPLIFTVSVVSILIFAFNNVNAAI